MKVIVAKAIGNQCINVRGLDETTEAAVLGKAHVVEVQDKHIRRARFWFHCFGIPLLGFGIGPTNLAFELLAVLGKGIVVVGWLGVLRLA